MKKADSTHISRMDKSRIIRSQAELGKHCTPSTEYPTPNTERPTEVSRTIRRRLIGPWTIIALVVGVILIWREGMLGSQSRPVILPPRILTSNAPQGMRLPVSALLSHPALRFTATQRQQIEAISAAEDKASKPILNRLKLDQNHIDLLVKQARDRGGISLDILRNEGMPIAVDSGEISRVRQAFWSQALAVLSPVQRIEAERWTGSLSAFVRSERRRS